MRVPLIDPVKALAAQVIVLHHMMFYSSMRGPLEEAFPALIGFLADPARYAVQVFLVIGGFLGMQGLLKRLEKGAYRSGGHSSNNTNNSTGCGQIVARPMGMGLNEFGHSLVNRYKRLVRPYAIAMLVACVMLVWVQGVDPVIELTPAEPLQLLAHVGLMHSLLDVPALSAGVWYVAIDFQLFAMGLLMLKAALCLGRRSIGHARNWLLAMVATSTVASLLVFNRDASLDIFGVFFFGSYGLGMLAAWAVQQRREWDVAALSTLLVSAALALQYRDRLWVTLATVGFLLLAPRVASLPRGLGWLDSRAGRFFQQSSYALFLIHYPLSILLFAIIDRMFLMGTAHNLAAAATCWTLFMAGAWWLMRAEVWIYDTLPSAITPRIAVAVQRLSLRPAVAA